MNEVRILSSFSDNYIYVLEFSNGLALAIDPGQANPVFDEINHRQLKLTHILVTHRHSDHIGGITLLKKKTDCVVVSGEGERINEADQQMEDGQILTINDLQIQCIATPGHTAGSVCYYLSGGNLKPPVLFTGDTLFVCGCGRMFESDGQTMWRSLQKLTSLPDETRVYPGHDYTEENIRFALIHRPADTRLLHKLKEVQSLAVQNLPTVPSTLADEKQLNLFLTAPDAQTFTHLRKQKDVF